MDLDDLRESVDQFFADKSRPASATKSDLLDLSEHCAMLADAIPDDDEGGGNE
jgi:hypothetical protein